MPASRAAPIVPASGCATLYDCSQLPLTPAPARRCSGGPYAWATELGDLMLSATAVTAGHRRGYEQNRDPDQGRHAEPVGQEVPPARIGRRYRSH